MREQSITTTSASTSVMEEEEKQERVIIPISQIHSLIDKELSFRIPGIISPTGIQAIREYLIKEGFNPPNGDTDGAYADPTWQWQWQTKKGNLPKRLGKWLKKRTSLPISPEVLANVGNLAKQHSSEENDEVYYFMISDRIDWKARQFGKGTNDSCWWANNDSIGTSSHAASFLKHGGLAVKFYNPPIEGLDRLIYTNENGVGRIWLMPEHEKMEYAILFNGYWSGQGATLRLSRALSTFLGLSYCKQDISSGKGWYINRTKLGYMIGPQTVLDRFPHELILFLPIKEPMILCSSCSKSTKEFNSRNRDGLVYCSTCYNERFKACGYCGETYNVGNVEFTTVHVSNNYSSRRTVEYCAECATRQAATCAICNTLHAKGNSVNATLYLMSTRSITSRRYQYNTFVVDHTSGYNAESEWVDLGTSYICSPTCMLAVPRCQDCKHHTLLEDAMGKPTCKRCEDTFESEITLDGLDLREPEDYDPLPDEIRELTDEWRGCHCSTCSVARDNKAIEDFNSRILEDPF